MMVEINAKEAYELMITRYVGIGSYTILVWDHLLTFNDEVRFIWRSHKKGPFVWLFFLNRYMTPLVFIVNLIAYLSNVFDQSTCEHFVRYEGATNMIGINIASLMMLLRIYALYEGRRAVVALVTIVFLAEAGTNGWLLTYGIAVPRSPDIHACTMIFNPTQIPGPVAAASAWLPLLYDTLILGLTVLRTFRDIKLPSVGRTTRILFKEGVFYYSVIFCVTFALTLMIIRAPDGLKNVLAQTEYLLSVAMMSRITLHLKRELHRPNNLLGSGTTYDLASSMSAAARFSLVNFAHEIPGAATPGPVTVQSATRDGRGQDVQVPKKSHVKRESWNAQEEWFEFAPLRTDGGNDRIA